MLLLKHSSGSIAAPSRPKHAVSDSDFFFSAPDFTEKVWLRLIYNCTAKKWHQNPRSPTPQPTTPPKPHSPSSSLGPRRGWGQVAFVAMKEPPDTTDMTKQRGEGGAEMEIEGGTQKDYKNNNKSGKKTNNREKNKWEKRERSRRSSEAPKVLELIKMICIYLWGLMSSFSIVCFPLIWIFPFHYVT